jgi:hypothetical protein
MSNRAVLIGVAIAAMVLPLVLLSGPRLTGNPPVLDCGGAEPAVCTEKVREAAQHAQSSYGWSGAVVSFTFEPHEPGSTCGHYAIEVFRLTFGPIGWASGFDAYPLC